MERLMIFIDGSNLFFGCQLYKKGYKIDLIKLRDKLVENRTLIRPYYYGSIPLKGNPEQLEKQNKFFDFLRRNGFDVKIIPLRFRTESFTCDQCGNQQKQEKQIEKGVDVYLVTDLLSLGIQKCFEIAVIVAGDLDYLKAIEEIKKKGIRVEIAFFETAGISKEFKLCADKFIPLENISSGIEKK